MSKTRVLTKRCLREILRDPLSLVFCLGFPVVMLVGMQVLFGNLEFVPENFCIENYAVGICVFGYTFDMLFLSLLMAGDKETEFINRIYIAPVSKRNYVLSFLCAMAPIALVQTVLFFLIALLFGLPFGLPMLLAVLYLIPSILFYLSVGVFLGTVSKNVKQTGPLSSIVISLASMLGGVFMPVKELGTFSEILRFLPFTHTVEIASGVFSGDYGCIYPHILWVVGYAAVFFLVSLLLYRKKEC